jgi:hypothetical protein
MWLYWCSWYWYIYCWYRYFLLWLYGISIWALRLTPPGVFQLRCRSGPAKKPAGLPSSPPNARGSLPLSIWHPRATCDCCRAVRPVTPQKPT